MKYDNYDIVFQEIPDEVTLAINITQCPNHCKNCHSPHLQQDIGKNLTFSELSTLVDRYKDSITCLCFMGGDANRQEVEQMAAFLHQISDIKVAWYSGQNTLPQHFEYFQYVKLGPYIPERGSLKSRNTNQRLYQNCCGLPMDITSRFW